MARHGPFEARPRLAVAVSGGPDSLALCLLAARWAGARGGQVIGLIVDHGLRTGSAAEARQTATWLAAHGVAHEVLTWRGPKPASAIQATARAARYTLLQDWCRNAAILHLLLAHHADDQAETAALRRARGSGPDGLAGMPAVREVPGLRLVRPLLGVPKARLIATLKTARQPWLDDPSNRALRFARSRLRLGPAIDVPALCAIAASAADARTRLDLAVAAWLVETTRIDPAGFALLARTALRNAALELARRALQQILATIGGGAYPPRQARLGGLLELVRSPAGAVRRTLAGCRIVDHGAALLFCREAGAIRHIAPLPARGALVWDDRYVLQARRHGMSPEPGLSVRALGQSSRSVLSVTPPARRALRRRLPAAVLPSLPALWQGNRLVAVPHLGLCVAELAAASAIEIRFQPRHPLAAAPFGSAR